MKTTTMNNIARKLKKAIGDVRVRHLSQKFYMGHVEKNPKKENSFVTNAFCGKIEASQIFPYPNILNKEQRETLENIAKPVEQFFYEISTKAVKSSNEEAFKRLWELGAFSLQVPKNLGGMGLSNTQYARLVEIIGGHDLGVGITLGAHESLGYKGILLYGNEHQKKKYLERVTHGEFAAFCLTEPLCGSDVTSLSTRAVLSDDGKNYMLNGVKLWLSTKNEKPNILTVLAKTNGISNTKLADNVTAFVVEKDYPGVSIKLPCGEKGDEDKSTNTVEVEFKNVKVPVDNILGGVGNGYRVAMTVLNNGRFGMVASLAGTMRSCINKATTFVADQKLFGEKMRTFAAVEEKLARMATQQYVTESMAYLISSNMDRSTSNYTIEAAISKCFASEAAWKVCDEAIQIMSGNGYLRDTELEHLLKDLRTFRTFEGTNDVLRLYIALTGIQFATPPIEALQNALKNPIDRFDYIVDKLSSKIFSMTGLYTFSHIRKDCHPKLRFTAYQLGRTIDSFHLALAMAIIVQGKKLETQQYLLNVIAESAIDIYSSACALSRASNALEQNLPTAVHEMRMVKFWISETAPKIYQNARTIMLNRQSSYKNYIKDIAKQICDARKIPTKNPLNL